MSLFKNPTTGVGNKNVWAQFEPEAINSQNLPPVTEAETFIALDQTDQTQIDFIPFCEIGNDTQGSNGETAHTSENKTEPKSEQEKIESIERDAYEKGFAQGEKDGLEIGEEKAKIQLQHIGHLVEELEDLQSNIVKNQEKQILEIIFAVAEKITLTQIQIDQDVVRRTLFAALELSATKQKINLRVNPKDFDLIERVKPEIFNRFKDLKALTITADPAVKRGGCRLDSQQGEIDATIETQLDKIYEDLKTAFIEG